MSRLQRAIEKRFPRVGDAVRAASDLSQDGLDNVRDALDDARDGVANSIDNVTYDARRSAQIASARAAQAISPRRFRRQELIVSADPDTTRAAVEAAIMEGNDGQMFMGIASPSRTAPSSAPLEWRLIQGYAVARTFQAWITVSPTTFTRTHHEPNGKTTSEEVLGSALTIVATGKSLRPTATEKSFFDGSWGGKVQAAAEGRPFDRRDITFDRGIF